RIKWRIRFLCTPTCRKVERRACCSRWAASTAALFSTSKRDGYNYVADQCLYLARPRHRINQLPCDANFPRCLAYSPLKDIAHAKPAPDFLDIDGFAFEGETRVARDHEQRFEPRALRSCTNLVTRGSSASKAGLLAPPGTRTPR